MGTVKQGSGKPNKKLSSGTDKTFTRDFVERAPDNRTLHRIRRADDYASEVVKRDIRNQAVPAAKRTMKEVQRRDTEKVLRDAFKKK